ncbi:sugar O-acyltransferase, sialic acid O-acetyltransferase NeuD family [Roseovarius nanhaiticus]|uniref:Sugar O-acyltransferase, sialic acid O-acetyltransferase NeuD family n=1 Tax=Roseovarius nanhaiticus TaxID=573024 RepID=A0A1N7EP30_9RHOB|nr:acetyltransferase [Roseovarius nanhaiticus]SEK70214.1 sugar O-acyltransferase, sialic acid O-acetyltransferase NeuD family [Roseovarius nanhaiticus]SIR89851.1 sugar O-acyltransferase, sialic acid O-acetyltransferase NeuD family [Roseovarius nanhaiticus]
MKSLRIIGAGGHGKVVADTAMACGYGDIAFLDDAFPEKQAIGAWPILGKLGMGGDVPLFCGIGTNSVRAKLFDTYSLGSACVLVHPSSLISSSATIGAGTLVVAGCIVNADAYIGKGVILNTACSVDHDCRIGDFVHISPGARLAGNVTVADGSWIGIGAVVREGVTIGKNAIVGAGAAVIEDVAEGGRVGGVPARELSKKA